MRHVSRSLLLLRHAKASRDPVWRDDHERPLEPRGERAAALVGLYLAQQGWEPGLALCSTAVRARQTLEAVRGSLPPRLEVRLERALYLASPGQLLAAVNALDERVETVLLVGHNPGLGDLAVGLAGSGDSRARAHLEQKFPTAALAAVGFDGPWSEVAPGSGRLVDFVTPKDLV